MGGVLQDNVSLASLLRTPNCARVACSHCCLLRTLLPLPQRAPPFRKTQEKQTPVSLQLPGTHIALQEWAGPTSGFHSSPSILAVKDFMATLVSVKRSAGAPSPHSGCVGRHTLCFAVEQGHHCTSVHKFFSKSSP